MAGEVSPGTLTPPAQALAHQEDARTVDVNADELVLLPCPHAVHELLWESHGVLRLCLASPLVCLPGGQRRVLPPNTQPAQQYSSPTLPTRATGLGGALAALGTATPVQHHSTAFPSSGGSSSPVHHIPSPTGVSELLVDTQALQLLQVPMLKTSTGWGCRQKDTEKSTPSGVVGGQAEGIAAGCFGRCPQGVSAPPGPEQGSQLTHGHPHWSESCFAQQQLRFTRKGTWLERPDRRAEEVSLPGLQEVLRGCLRTPLLRAAEAAPALSPVLRISLFAEQSHGSGLLVFGKRDLQAPRHRGLAENPGSPLARSGSPPVSALGICSRFAWGHVSRGWACAKHAQKVPKTNLLLINPGIGDREPPRQTP